MGAYHKRGVWFRVFAMGRLLWLRGLGVGLGWLGAFSASASEKAWTKPMLGQGRTEGPGGAVLYRYCDPSAKLKKSSLRAVSYNIYLGGRWRLEKDQLEYLPSLGKVMDNIAAQGEFDFLGLQEVDVGGRRVSGVDPADVIAHRFGLCGVFGLGHDFRKLGGDTGRFGNAILGRVPFEDYQVVHYDAANRNWLEKQVFEKRAASEIRVVVPTAAGGLKSLHVLSTHLSAGWKGRLETEDRLRQIVQLRELLRRFGKDPVLLMGDFNSQPGSEEMGALLRFTAADKAAGYRELRSANELTGQAWVGTFAGHDDPARPPSSQLDHFLISGLGRARGFRAWRPEKAHEQGSDHLPIILNIEF